MLQVVCFSKGRPLQLHGYLTSLFAQCQDTDQLQVKVLLHDQPKWFAEAYAEVEEEFLEVEFRRERNFKTDLDSLLGQTELTMFGCDDDVITRPFSVNDLRVVHADDILGLSLRLGRHITQDMFGGAMLQPAFEEDGSWSIDGAAGDWGYPWEVLGTVYETEFVQRVVAQVNASSPSQLEARGALCWAEHTPKRRMTAWPESRLVVPTVNLVQDEYPNGIRGNIVLDPGFLLDCWKHGLRLDVTRYEGFLAPSWRVADFYLARQA